MAKFNYADPDQTPVKGAAVATIDITLTGANLCSCAAAGGLAIDIEVEWIGSGGGNPLANFNKVAPGLGEFLVNGVKVTFPTPAAGAPNSSKAKASTTVALATCPDGAQIGSGEIKVVDLTRKGRTIAGMVMSGVSQIYRYDYSYGCTRQADARGHCQNCSTKYPFKYFVTLASANTVIPNL